MWRSWEHLEAGWPTVASPSSIRLHASLHTLTVIYLLPLLQYSLKQSKSMMISQTTLLFQLYTWFKDFFFLLCLSSHSSFYYYVCLQTSLGPGKIEWPRNIGMGKFIISQVDRTFNKKQQRICPKKKKNSRNSCSLSFVVSIGRAIVFFFVTWRCGV